ncbi:MAG: FIST N-terminal domain-containing protein, partial [Elusimicrobiota bacterium]
MKIGTGISFKDTPGKRVYEASDNAMAQAVCVRAEIALVFTQSHSEAGYKTAIETASKVTGAASVIAVAASGVITEGGEWEKGPSCAVMVFGEDTASKIFTGTLDVAGHEKEDRLKPEHKAMTASMMVLGDPANLNAGALLRLQNRIKAPVFGAASSAYLDDDSAAPVLYQDRWLKDSCAFLSFSKELVAHTGLAHGCKAMCGPFMVTKSRDALVLELAGKPAARILERELGRIVAQRKASCFEKPLPLMAGVLSRDPVSGQPPQADEFSVRPILGIDSATGGILLNEGLREGSYITFVLREKMWAKGEIERGVGAVKERLAGAKPAFGFYYNGVGRGHDLYSQENYDI